MHQEERAAFPLPLCSFSKAENCTLRMDLAGTSLIVPRHVTQWKERLTVLLGAALVRNRLLPGYLEFYESSVDRDKLPPPLEYMWSQEEQQNGIPLPHLTPHYQYQSQQQQQQQSCLPVSPQQYAQQQYPPQQQHHHHHHNSQHQHQHRTPQEYQQNREVSPRVAINTPGREGVLQDILEGMDLTIDLSKVSLSCDHGLVLFS